jgi:hypothetical protein
VTDPKKWQIGPENQALVLRLLEERLEIRAVARATSCGPVPTASGSSMLCIKGIRPTTPGPPKKVRDKLCSLVGSKANVQLVWVALEAETLRVLATVV